MGDLLCVCLFGAKSTLLYARLSSTFDLVTSLFLSQQRETKEMGEQKTPGVGEELMLEEGEEGRLAKAC